MKGKVVNFPIELLNKLEKEAKKRYMNLSEFIRYIAVEFLKKNEN